MLVSYRIVKLTSPGLNYFLLFGIALMSISTIVLPERDYVMIATFCAVRTCVML